MSQPNMGSIFHIKNQSNILVIKKLLCELSKLSKLNAFILLGYQTNIDASILVYKFRPERTGFNMYAPTLPNNTCQTGKSDWRKKAVKTQKQLLFLLNKLKLFNSVLKILMKENNLQSCRSSGMVMPNLLNIFLNNILYSINLYLFNLNKCFCNFLRFYIFNY